MKEVLKKIEDALKESENSKMFLDYREASFKDGKEIGLEIAIDIIKEYLNNQ